jgi:cell cycle checkpoint control protein RAD9A
MSQTLTLSQWDLSVTNTSKSAFCLFTLLPSFFFRYKALGTAEQRRRGVKCKLYVKVR